MLALYFRMVPYIGTMSSLTKAYNDEHQRRTGCCCYVLTHRQLFCNYVTSISQPLESKCAYSIESSAERLSFSPQYGQLFISITVLHI